MREARLDGPRVSGRSRWRTVLLVVLLLAAACGGRPPTLTEVVAQAVAAGPGRDAGTYRAPDALLAHRVAGAALSLLAGDDDPPVPDGLRLADAVDTAGRAVATVGEDPEGEVHGWGTYAVRTGAGAPARLVVEVPHPRADRRTEQLGEQLFAALGADALLVAGAHRTAGDGADVAHEPASVFAAVDRALVGADTVVVQVHGFDDSRRESSADVVLSSTVSRPGSLVLDLAEALEDAGFRPCVYDGEDCDALAGTRNAQGAHARAVGASFVHLELSAGIRTDARRRDELTAALASVLAG